MKGLNRRGLFLLAASAAALAAAGEYDVPAQVLLDRRAGGWSVVGFSAVY